jgi:hypothetical protein
MMRLLKWLYDEKTVAWTKELPVPITIDQQPQYAGHTLSDDTVRPYLPPDGHMPTFCYVSYETEDGPLVCSPANIIRCFEGGYFLQALALTASWGGLLDTAPAIYTVPLAEIKETLHICKNLTHKTGILEGSWNLLVNRLRWNDIIASTTLHFLARSLGYDANPPVPIDNHVIEEHVWPRFFQMVEERRLPGTPPPPELWRDQQHSWQAYNRYMSVINAWARRKGWTTTQVASTLFVEYGSGTQNGDKAAQQ